MLRLLVLSLIFALALPLPQVWAAPSGCPFKAKAKALYQEGQKHYRMERFNQAITAFSKAHKLCPTTAMVFNLARAHDRAGNNEQAVFLYQEYLKAKDPRADAALIKRRLADLRKRPRGEIWRDPFQGATMKPEKVPVRPEKVPAASNKALVPPTQSVPGFAPIERPQTRWKRPWAWVTTGLGVALVGTGVALLATRRVDEWRRDEDSGKLESVTDAWGPGAVLIGVGAAAAGVGTWLFLRGEGPAEEPGKVTFGITGTGVVLGGTF